MRSLIKSFVLGFVITACCMVVLPATTALFTGIAISLLTKTSR
jgi:hypothetical protein